MFSTQADTPAVNDVSPLSTLSTAGSRLASMTGGHMAGLAAELQGLAGGALLRS